MADTPDTPDLDEVDETFERRRGLEPAELRAGLVLDGVGVSLALPLMLPLEEARREGSTRARIRGVEVGAWIVSFSSRAAPGAPVILQSLPSDGEDKGDLTRCWALFGSVIVEYTWFDVDMLEFDLIIGYQAQVLTYSVPRQRLCSDSLNSPGTDLVRR